MSNRSSSRDDDVEKLDATDNGVESLGDEDECYVEAVDSSNPSYQVVYQKRNENPGLPQTSV